MNSILREISDWPETVDSDTVAQMVNRCILVKFGQLGEVEECMSTLGDYQWHTYQEPDAEMRERLEAWLLANWQAGDSKYVKIVLVTAYCFALSKGIFERALSAYTGEDRDEYVSYLSASPGAFIDPYSSMRGGSAHES